MEEMDQILIERYLAHELTSKERSEVELRAQHDARFKQELTEYQLAIESLKLAQRDELKNRFRQRDKVLDRQNKDFNIGSTSNLWLLGAAAVLAILLAWQFLFVSQRTPDEAKVDKRDPTQVVQNPPIRMDTIKSQELQKDPKEGNKKSVKTKNKGQEMFAANFEPYTDDSMDPSARGNEEELTALEKFQLHYWEGNYREALSIFNDLTPSLQANDNLRFLYANSLMSLNRIDEAATILTEIVQNGKSPYSAEASLYLAMCYLKNEKYTEAKKYLHAYLEDPDSTQKEKARKILAGLN